MRSFVTEYHHVDSGSLINLIVVWQELFVVWSEQGKKIILCLRIEDELIGGTEDFSAINLEPCLALRVTISLSSVQKVGGGGGRGAVAAGTKTVTF